MRKHLLVIFLIIFLIGCKKENKIDEVIYSVALINATTWHGSYLNENAQVVGVENAPDGWTYSFKNTNNLSTLQIDGYTDGFRNGADAFLIIKVYSLFVASGHSSISPSLSYVFP